MPPNLLQSQLPSGNLPYLFAAFAVIWAIFFAYVFFVTRRQQELRNEISRLRHALERDSENPPPGPADV